MITMHGLLRPEVASGISGHEPTVPTLLGFKSAKAPTRAVLQAM